MTEDDEKQLEKMIEGWLMSKTMEERIRQVISWDQTERYLKKSGEWANRLPFLIVGAAIGFFFALMVLWPLWPHK